MVLRQPLLVRDALTDGKIVCGIWFVSDCALSRCIMLEVLYAVSGKSIAVFEREDFADATVRALRQRLAQKIGVPRFRLRLLQDNCPLDDDQTLIDDQTLTLQVVTACDPGVSAA